MRQIYRLLDYEHSTPDVQKLSISGFSVYVGGFAGQIWCVRCHHARDTERHGCVFVVTTTRQVW